ncbi:MAG: 50S ribosomal protein L25 [Candidatus Omnitrophota bacterium]
MKQVEISVQRREKIGKGAARSSRRAGRVPAVIYGGNGTSIPVSVDRHEIERAIHSGGESENIVVNVAIAGEDAKELALVRQTQHDPLSGALEHLDFLRISIDKTITTTVPIHPVGSCKGVKAGGIFEQLLRDVEIECLPLEIPDCLEIDVTELDLAHSLHVSDIPGNPKYKILTAPDRTVASVALPKVEAAPGAPAAAAEGEAEKAAEGSEKSE